MPDPRRYIGVRISEQGHRYIQLVEQREKAAGNDQMTYSAALRYLLALGVRSDMEAHNDSDRLPATSVERSVATSDVRADDVQRGDRHGDPGSRGVSHLPDRGPANVGDAIGHLVRAGLNPAPVEASEDDNSAA